MVDSTQSYLPPLRTRWIRSCWGSCCTHSFLLVPSTGPLSVNNGQLSHPFPPSFSAPTLGSHICVCFPRNLFIYLEFLDILYPKCFPTVSLHFLVFRFDPSVDAFFFRRFFTRKRLFFTPVQPFEEDLPCLEGSQFRLLCFLDNNLLVFCSYCSFFLLSASYPYVSSFLFIVILCFFLHVVLCTFQPTHSHFPHDARWPCPQCAGTSIFPGSFRIRVHIRQGDRLATFFLPFFCALFHR